MLRRIQALNFRCLRYVDLELDRFHVLVGPNGSGKSALFDAIAFVGDLISGGFDHAVDERTNNFQDLVWGRPWKNVRFELALEFDNPDDLGPLDNREVSRIRYELMVDEGNDVTPILRESLIVTDQPASISTESESIPDSICLSFPNSNELPVRGLIDMRETFGPGRSMLNLSPSVGRFPAKHLSQMLCDRFRVVFLDGKLLRRASRPKALNGPILPDGSNLPWAIQRLRNDAGNRFEKWLDHVRTAIRDLRDIRVVEREDDRHAYLMIQYANGVEVPSWSVSEGTLRLLALTLIAYLPDSDFIYLLEEPENGIHPLAVETVYQSLSSMWDSQVLIASHSPELLMCTKPENVLCFSRNDEGAAEIIPGDQHPRLSHWRSAADVDLLFASEILG